MRSAPTRGLLICALLCSRQVGALWQDAGEPDTFIDKLEYKVEIDRHERLAATRKAAGVTLAPFVSDGCSGGQSAGWALASSRFDFLLSVMAATRHRESCARSMTKSATRADRQMPTQRPALKRGVSQTSNCAHAYAGLARSERKILMTEYGLGRDEVTLLYRGIADAMYRAVRLGGAPCTRLPWRWGFGWPTANEARLLDGNQTRPLAEAHIVWRAKLSSQARRG